MRECSGIRILGVRVNPLSPSELVSYLAAGVAPDSPPRVVVYANPYNLVMAARNEMLQRAFASADIVHVDGVGVALAARALGCRGATRAVGHRLLPDVLASVARRRCPTFLLGAREDVISLAAAEVKARWPSLPVVGYHHGYFEERDATHLVDAINASGARLLLVGMGSPKQETWIARHRDRLQVGLIWSVGAAFDFLSGQERQCPRWMHVVGLEWVYRLLRDPKGKWCRYLVSNVGFVCGVARQLISQMGEEAQGT